MGAALFKRGWGVSNWITPWFHGPWGRLLERWRSLCFYVKAIPSPVRCRWGFIRVHTVPRFVAVHDVHVVPSWRRFQLKSTPRVASYSLSLSLSLFSLFHSRSVSVPSLVGRRLSITLSLSLVPAQNSLLLFFFFLSLSLSLCLVFGWSLCLFSLLLHIRFFLLFCFVSYSFLSSFLLSFSPFR